MQRFLALLEHVDPDLDPEEIADLLWLAGQIDPSTTIAEAIAPQNLPPVPPKPQPASPPKTRDPAPPTRQHEPTVDVTLPPAKTPERQTPAPQTTFAEMPFKAPTAPGLRNKLELCRSLRPLMRKVPSRTDMIVDEEATAIAIVENPDRQWLPVLTAAPERWLDLAVVVENSRSTAIWQELIQEVQQLLERLGAFRTIRFWTLQADDGGNLQLFPRRLGSQKTPRSVSPKQLVDASGRQLILIVSDCVSPLWRRVQIHPWLKEWSQLSLMAILQLLPERLWDRSGLGLGSAVSVRAFVPGTANSRLEPIDLPEWAGLNRLEDVILPIVTLEPDSLEQWAKVMGGLGNTQAAGVVFNLVDRIQQQTATTTIDPHLPPPVEPEALLQRFRVTASPLARRLAVLMSIVPVSLPVVYLIQEAMLPGSRQVHIAEVFMSGLLVSTPIPDSSAVQYEFVAGVREILQGSTSKSETLQLLDRVAIYIANRAGLGNLNFAALLRLQAARGNAVGEEVLSFARISTQMVRRMGRDYAAWVDSLELVGSLPTIESVEFEVVTIEFTEDRLPLEPFDFEVATLTGTKAQDEALNEVFKIADAAIVSRTNAHLTALQQEIIEGTWKNLSYAEIADREHLSTGYVSKVGAALFRSLGEELGNPISKKNLVAVFERLTGKPRQSGLTITRSPGRAYQFVERLTARVVLEMVQIPAGEFMMGALEDEIDSNDRERPQHRVTVPEFYMGKYPISQAQWRFGSSLPQIDRQLDPDPSYFKGDNLPVEQVSWYDAIEFCARLSRHTGRTYRLPSEAEWEYACRARTTTPFHSGETILTDLANYNGDYVYGSGSNGIYRRKTTTVGTFPPNVFGLCDMHGNVWEWCEDHWHENYEGAPINGSSWLNLDASENDFRMLRGGSWVNYPLVCRSAVRVDYSPDVRNDFVGFRVVCGAARTD